ncbi:undecaprenyl-phosphate galactose phosphotransferase [Megasphaera paucivorans]|uniref:Undecaprenyl-phosphate galactose phosphotransferase n=1 Tax=Megasphaera paucivorans TaxID=349095 RepID=A0A1G9PVQ0_9FIRM|nr:undecaprenyl-phosphate galactose phosphotransferase [Megasphaera paucivorans]
MKVWPFMSAYKLHNENTISIKNKYTTIILPLVLMLGDYCAIVCAESLAFYLRNFFIPNGGILHISWLSWYVICPVIYVFFMQANGLYVRRIQFWRTISCIFNANVYATATIIVLMYAAQIAGTTSRLFLLFLWVFSFFIIILFRFIVKKMLEKFCILQIPVLVMGAGKTAALILEYFQHDTGMGHHLIGYLEDHVPNPKVASMMPQLGKFQDAERVIKETGVRHVIVIAPGLNTNAVQEIVYRLQPLVKSISFVPDMGNMPLAVLDMESFIDGHIVAFSVRNNLAHWYNRWIKRIFDIVCTIVNMICLSPLLMFIAFFIYIDSPGPVIFKHKRIGKNGKLFSCYKFRSMCVNADEKLQQVLKNNPTARVEWERNFKLKNDPRITRIGIFLRKTSLDELPQLFNVLKGEMSLVGPRPIVQKEVLRYGKYIEDYYMVRPSITGMWQTSGRSDIDYNERVQMDTWYVRNWNVWFDVVLIWRTIKVVIGGKGAY